MAPLGNAELHDSLRGDAQSAVITITLSRRAQIHDPTQLLVPH